jgi:dTDP-glucose 4,6-dehydratase
MKILVTGGAGFIGGNFIRKTLSSIPGVSIHNLDALTYSSSIESLKEFDSDTRYTFSRGSITDEAFVKYILRTYNPDCVINFAAQTHVDRSIDDPWPFIDTNIVGTFVLLDEIRRWYDQSKSPNFRFIHVSTDEVYGSTTAGNQFTEETPYDPSSPYSASKASSDHLARAYYRTYDIPIIITNCCNNYGPYQFPEKLIPLMILNGIEGKELPIYGNGQNIRDWMHVDDHIQALWCVSRIGVPGETYNIGANCELTNVDVVNMICDALDQLSADGKIPVRKHRDLIKFVDDRPGHDMVYSICSDKVRSLGWLPTIGFDAGLLRTVQWYYNNIEWVAHIHDRGRLGNAQGDSASWRRGNKALPDYQGG